MPHSHDAIIKKNPATELDIIKQKRAALQQLVKLTNTFNQLHQGLKSVVLLGGPVSQIPENIFIKYQLLSDSLKNKSVDILHNTLLSTDQKIQNTIKHVLEISQKSDALLEQYLGATGSRLVDVLKDDYHEYVGDFKKNSQTSIGLRITLESRKVTVKSFHLPVPESFIKKQIADLDEREKLCREVIKRDMSALQGEVHELIASEDCPQPIKQTLLEIQSELQVNSEHLHAGKTIEEMPILFESIELSGEAQAIQEVEALAQEDQNSPADDAVDGEQAGPKKLGFFKHLGRWLNSSWKKKWHDIE